MRKRDGRVRVLIEDSLESGDPVPTAKTHPMTRDATQVLSSHQWHTVGKTSINPENPNDLIPKVLEVVAEAENCDPADIGPPLLQTVVDIDAVKQALFDTTNTTNVSAAVCTRFFYRGWRITLDSDGKIFVADSG